MMPKTYRETSRNDNRRRIDKERDLQEAITEGTDDTADSGRDLARGEGGSISSPEAPGDLSKDDEPRRNFPDDGCVGVLQRNVAAMSHTVLVVDDDPGVLDVVVAMLEDLGCEVISAPGGSDALDRLRENRDISILITDINMPGMDGHELAELARRVRPELKVLQLSGREPRRGGLPMIRKPFSFEELADVLQRTTGIH